MKINNVSVISVLGVGAILVLASVAGAFPGYLDAFNSRYGTKGSRLDTCQTCHSTNYQSDILAQLERNMSFADALTAVEPLDSDGDQHSNIEEITARTFPGNPNDFPGHVCTDKDGDEYAVEGGACGAIDCDDNNPNVHPGATEVCGDKIDNNCDGQIDEGCAGRGGGGSQQGASAGPHTALKCPIISASSALR
jgi:hypothetical protein